jgi:hypothetical protein
MMERLLEMPNSQPRHPAGSKNTARCIRIYLTHPQHRLLHRMAQRQGLAIRQMVEAWLLDKFAAESQVFLDAKADRTARAVVSEGIELKLLHQVFPPPNTGKVERIPLS